jgi:hypothetical protein
MDLNKTERLSNIMIMAGFICLLTGALLLVAMPVTALDLAFADSTLQGEQDVMIVAANGTLLYEGNTSATATVSLDDFSDVNGTLLVHIKPATKNILATPDTLLNEIGRQVEGNLITLIFIGIIGLVLFGRGR